MKVFDYRNSGLKQFVLTMGDTVTIWKQAMLFATHVDLLAQHQASVGYVAVQTIDDNGHLESRDLIKLIGGGQACLLFDTDATVHTTYWTDYDLVAWYNNDRNLWHRVRQVSR